MLNRLAAQKPLQENSYLALLNTAARKLCRPRSMADLLAYSKMKRNRPIFVRQGAAHFDAYARSSSKEKMPPFIVKALAEWDAAQAGRDVDDAGDDSPNAQDAAGPSVGSPTPPGSKAAGPSVGSTAPTDTKAAGPAAAPVAAADVQPSANVCSSYPQEKPEKTLAGFEYDFFRIEMDREVLANHYFEVYNAYLAAKHGLLTSEKNLPMLLEARKEVEEEIPELKKTYHAATKKYSKVKGDAKAKAISEWKAAQDRLTNTTAMIEAEEESKQKCIAALTVLGPEVSPVCI